MPTQRYGEADTTHCRNFDAVRIYEALDNFTSMKPVVVNPTITFNQLIQELESTEGDPLSPSSSPTSAFLRGPGNGSAGPHHRAAAALGTRILASRPWTTPCSSGARGAAGHASTGCSPANWMGVLQEFQRQVWAA